MRSRIVPILAAMALWSSRLVPSTTHEGKAERSFRFDYAAEVPIADNTGAVRVWLPYPVSDAHQEVTSIEVDAPAKTELRKETKYGNTVLYFEVDHPKEPVKVEVSFQVKRYEYVHRPGEQAASASQAPADPSAGMWLKPDRLVPNSPKIKALAEEITKGKTTDLEKA